MGKSLSVGGMSQPSSSDRVGAHACLMELLLQLNRVSLTAEVQLFSDKKRCFEIFKLAGSYRTGIGGTDLENGIAWVTNTL